MPFPTTLGSSKEYQDSAVMIALSTYPTATATATASDANTSAVTINAGQGIITSPALTTSTVYSLIVTNSVVSANDIVWIGLQNGTNTATVFAACGLVTVKNGSFSVMISNINTAAHNGTIQLCFGIDKPVSKTVAD